VLLQLLLGLALRHTLLLLLQLLLPQRGHKVLLLLLLLLLHLLLHLLQPILLLDRVSKGLLLLQCRAWLGLRKPYLLADDRRDVERSRLVLSFRRGILP
jgi:hypothetical protein